MFCVGFFLKLAKKSRKKEQEKEKYLWGVKSINVMSQKRSPLCFPQCTTNLQIRTLGSNPDLGQDPNLGFKTFFLL
jgi:hypothetical protein